MTKVQFDIMRATGVRDHNKIRLIETKLNEMYPSWEKLNAGEFGVIARVAHRHIGAN